MSATKSSPFRLDQFSVIEFSIKRNPVKQGTAFIDIPPSAVIDEDKKAYVIYLEVNLKGEKDSCNIALKADGLFKFKSTMKQEELSNYFYVNAPAIIFPYIRAYVASVSALSGLSPINLPVMNLTGLGEELKKKTRKVKSEKV